MAGRCIREEVRLALEAGCIVIPVTVGNARLPSDADLADFPELQPLLKRSGRDVRPDPLFDTDIARIVDGLEQIGPGETIGTTLDGKYTLTAEIGVGGMGVVYLAQQKKPVQRTVAVKLIKPGMDSRDVLARFDAERQALAVMDHPGDLDWIVMKCLEKENARRYASATQLGEELRRFLADEPVQAGPPSARYRMKKFLRRNRGPVIAASLVVLALIAGIIGTSIGLADTHSRIGDQRFARQL